jgi:hypothetical protein
MLITKTTSPEAIEAALLPGNGVSVRIHPNGDRWWYQNRHLHRETVLRLCGQAELASDIKTGSSTVMMDLPLNTRMEPASGGFMGKCSMRKEG